jgi:hypothetical protein
MDVLIPIGFKAHALETIKMIGRIEAKRRRRRSRAQMLRLLKGKELKQMPLAAHHHHALVVI